VILRQRFGSPRAAGDDAGDDDDAAGTPGGTTVSSIRSASEKSSSLSATASMSVSAADLTVSQFLAQCRERAFDRAEELPNETRSRVKRLLIRMCTIAVSAVYSSPACATTAHVDVLQGRDSTQRALEALSSVSASVSPAPLTPDSLSSPPSICGSICGSVEDRLSKIPVFLSLFINELITLSCACITLTVEDKPLRSVQSAAAALLCRTVKLFLSTADPDGAARAHSTALSPLMPFGGAAERILQQYLSQTLSAVRALLLVRYDAGLLAAAGEVIFDLMRLGFLRDKIAIRRLLKIALASYEAEPLPLPVPVQVDSAHTSLRLPLRLRRPAGSPPDTVSDETAAVEQVVLCANAAKLFVLSLPAAHTAGLCGEGCEDVTECRQEVAALFSGPVLRSLAPIWSAVLSDAARVQQGREGGWPTGSTETDARRGGLCYAAHVDPEVMQPHLIRDLPYIAAALAAASSSGETPLSESEADNGDHIALFSLICILFGQYCQDVNASDLNRDSHKSSAVTSTGHVLLSALISLSSARPCVPPVAQWAPLMDMVSQRLLPILAEKCRFQTVLCVLSQVLTLCERLLEQEPALDGTGSPESLVDAVRRVVLFVAQRFLQRFDSTSAAVPSLSVDSYFNRGFFASSTVAKTQYAILSKVPYRCIQLLSVLSARESGAVDSAAFLAFRLSVCVILHISIHLSCGTSSGTVGTSGGALREQDLKAHLAECIAWYRSFLVRGHSSPAVVAEYLFSLLPQLQIWLSDTQTQNQTQPTARRHSRMGWGCDADALVLREELVLPAEGRAESAVVEVLLLMAKLCLTATENTDMVSLQHTVTVTQHIVTLTPHTAHSHSYAVILT
jgi:hypothetical protein